LNDSFAGLSILGLKILIESSVLGIFTINSRQYLV
jgi:hypothetical protein